MKAFSVIDHPLDPGIRLVEASAGTGKTYAITTLYVRLVVEAGLTVDQILVVTYTEAATAELRDRVRGRLRGAVKAFEGGAADEQLTELAATLPDSNQAIKRLTAALYAFDEAAIFTIHGFCQRMLQENAFESGTLFDTELMTDVRPLIDQIATDYWVQETHDAPDVFLRHLAAHSISPTTLRQLALRVTGLYELPVLPEEIPEMVPPDISGWEPLFEAARRVWKSDRSGVVSLLTREVIKGYREDHWLGRIAQIDKLMEQPAVEAVGLFKMFQKFTTSSLIAGVRAGATPPTHEFFDRAEALWDASVPIAQQLADWALRLQLRMVPYVRQELERRKADANALSFDDLLVRFRNALRKPGGGAQLARRVGGRFQAALIDEFQDTDPIQYEIFHTLFAESGRLFLIGDPKQSIYGFRGADIFAYLEAKADAGENAGTLRVNWRSDRNLVEALGTLFRRTDRPFVFDSIPLGPIEVAQSSPQGPTRNGDPVAPFRVLFLPPSAAGTPDDEKILAWRATNAIAEAVADDIERTLAEPFDIGSGLPVAARDIAVLTRTNKQTGIVQQSLRRRGIASVLYSDLSVFLTTEAKQLALVLLAVAEPSGRRAIKSALATDVFGWKSDALVALEQEDGPWEAQIDDFRGWRRIWENRGFIQAFRAMLNTREIPARLLRLPGGERRMTNLLHLSELLHTAAVEEGMGVNDLLRWFAERRDDRRHIEAAQMRLESDEDAVTILTVHKSKGLEFPVVYCPFLWDGTGLFPDDRRFARFHNPDRDNRLELDIGSAHKKASERLAEREARAENMRLLYVGLTRAKHACTVVWGPIKGSDYSPLGYLLHAAPGHHTAEQQLKKTAKRIRDLGATELLAEVQAFAAASGGRVLAEVIGRRTRPAQAAPAGLEEGPPPPSLSARTLPHRLERVWRVASFTQLSATSREIGPAALGLDRDTDAIETQRPDEEGRPVLLSEFPAGAKAGNFFHDIFEHLDFRGPAEERRALIESRLAIHGYPRDLWLDLVDKAVGRILESPLDPSGTIRLCDIARTSRLNELEFAFPVGSATDSRFSARRLAAVFERHGGSSLPASLPDTLSKLEFRPFIGFMRGFIDIVFEHGGRFSLVDYKSNFLGRDSRAYRPDRLPTAMMGGNYYLQYHLYAVALHRYLAWRLVDYDYDRHFGDVYYLFIRGMDPSASERLGVFRDRPERALIEALSGVLADPGGPR
jgi:exodeoxyribonuclease V beta subunit